MGCTSAKQVSAVPNDEEGRGKAYSNGDLYSGQFYSWLSGRCPQLRLTPQLSSAQTRGLALNPQSPLAELGSLVWKI